MFICNNSNPKFIYISCTKSGSSTLYNMIETQYGRTGNIKLQRPTKTIPENLFDNHYVFCVIRNPYARLVSWWWSICKTDGDRYGHKKELRQRGLSESLEDFLKLWKTKTQTRQYYVIEQNKRKIDAFIKLENLKEELDNSPIQLNTLEIPKVNSRNHPHWKELLSSESIKLINNIYKQDFITFGYEMI